jgi:hypothetical protein
MGSSQWAAGSAGLAGGEIPQLAAAGRVGTGGEGRALCVRGWRASHTYCQPCPRAFVTGVPRAVGGRPTRNVASRSATMARSAGQCRALVSVSGSGGGGPAALWCAISAATTEFPQLSGGGELVKFTN